MGEACRRFDTPVTGGNVSFYNQSPDGPVYPTPTIGMVGLVENLSKKMTLDFKKEGDAIYLLGQVKNDIASSEYVHKIVGISQSPAPHFDLEAEFELQQKIAFLIENGLILSAHDISEGGLFVTLCEKGFFRNLGFTLDVNNTIRNDAYLFGEAQSRVVVTVAPGQLAQFMEQVKNIDHQKIGTVSKSEIVINGENWGEINHWKELYDTAIERQLAKELESEGALTML
jgi:phosphoribosylformylglycinamidine synthase